MSCRLNEWDGDKKSFNEYRVELICLNKLNPAAAVTGTYELFRCIIDESIKQGKEVVNMCEAIKRTLEEERLEGNLEGELTQARKTARKMLRAGKPLNEIKEFTELSDEDIRALM